MWCCQSGPRSRRTLLIWESSCEGMSGSIVTVKRRWSDSLLVLVAGESKSRCVEYVDIHNTNTWYRRWLTTTTFRGLCRCSSLRDVLVAGPTWTRLISSLHTSGEPNHFSASSKPTQYSHTHCTRWIRTRIRLGVDRPSSSPAIPCPSSRSATRSCDVVGSSRTR